MLLLSIPPPMGLDTAATPAGLSDKSSSEAKARAVSHCAMLSLPEHEGEVKFDEVLPSKRVL